MGTRWNFVCVHPQSMFCVEIRKIANFYQIFFTFIEQFSQVFEYAIFA